MPVAAPPWKESAPFIRPGRRSEISSTATKIATSPVSSTPATIATSPVAATSAGVPPQIATADIPITMLASNRLVDKDGQKDRGANRIDKGDRRIRCRSNTADRLREIIAGQLLWIFG